MEQSELTVYREAWLQAAAAFLMDYVVERGLPRVEVRVSCGWPLRGGVGRRRTVIGQCFPPTASKDGKPQIFISPLLSESIDVLGVLLHELIHACFGCQFGHGKQFSQAARRAGLAGPPTATTVGDVLRPVLVSYVEQVGPYPHAAILVKPKDKIGSRLRLYQCGCEPPVKVRVASDRFQARCLVCDGLFKQA
ncbi:MAG TPA: SprT-like domain-containing protein [Ktedonobacteraceae bacterium]|nr:SprT-like domain-containing protein [Ktedonobacteraceae bacterium]